MTTGPELLKAWLKRAAMTQQELATKLGMDKTFINQILSGRRSPGLTSAKALQDETGVPAVAWVPTAVGTSTKRAKAKRANRQVA